MCGRTHITLPGGQRHHRPSPCSWSTGAAGVCGAIRTSATPFRSGSSCAPARLLPTPRSVRLALAGRGRAARRPALPRRRDYGVGRGTSAGWRADPDGQVRAVWTEPMPTAHVERVDPNEKIRKRRARHGEARRACRPWRRGAGRRAVHRCCPTMRSGSVARRPRSMGWATRAAKRQPRNWSRARQAVDA